MIATGRPLPFALGAFPFAVREGDTVVSVVGEVAAAGAFFTATLDVSGAAGDSASILVFRYGPRPAERGSATCSEDSVASGEDGSSPIGWKLDRVTVVPS